MREEIIGKKFGQLLVVAKETRRNKNGSPVSYLTVKCSCGVQYETLRINVTYEKTTRCKECYLKSMNPRRAEGESAAHPLYPTWVSMVQRCLVSTNSAHQNYGGRGITVCDRWRGERKQGQIRCSIDGFHNFLADMGPKPSPKHSIDRIDNNGNYEPSNCRWATSKEQASNRRPLAEWSNPEWRKLVDPNVYRTRTLQPSERLRRHILRLAKYRFEAQVAKQVTKNKADLFVKQMAKLLAT